MEMERSQLANWSRRLHAAERSNPFKREKIPYRTIIVAFIFFVIGSIFLLWGAYEFKETGYQEALEKWLLGFLLFIPGSYHTCLAV